MSVMPSGEGEGWWEEEEEERELLKSPIEGPIAIYQIKTPDHNRDPAELPQNAANLSSDPPRIYMPAHDTSFSDTLWAQLGPAARREEGSKHTTNNELSLILLSPRHLVAGVLPRLHLLPPLRRRKDIILRQLRERPPSLTLNGKT